MVKVCVGVRGGAMRAFEFLTAFVAILIGLAITDLATSLHRLLRARRRVKWDWATPLAALFVGVQVMAQFWVFWYSSGDQRFTFAALAGLALVLVLIFLMASAVLPDEVPEAGLDLRTFYDETRPYFWTLMAVYIAVVTVQEHRVFFAPAHRLDLAWQGTGVLMCIALALIRWRWAHALGLLIGLAGLVGRYFLWTTETTF
jgi:hypothetical protein